MPSVHIKDRYLAEFIRQSGDIADFSAFVNSAVEKALEKRGRKK